MARRSACRWGRRRSAPGSHGLWQAIRPLLPAPATPLRRPTRIDDRAGLAQVLPAGRPRRRPTKLHLDKGPTTHAAGGRCAGAGSPPRIARRDIESSGRLGRHRYVVEGSLAWLVGRPRVQVRDQRHADILLGFVHLTCALSYHKSLNEYRHEGAPGRWLSSMGRRRTVSTGAVGGPAGPESRLPGVEERRTDRVAGRRAASLAQPVLHRGPPEPPGVPPRRCPVAPWSARLHPRTPAQRRSRLVGADRQGVHVRRSPMPAARTPPRSRRPRWSSDRLSSIVVASSAMASVLLHRGPKSQRGPDRPGSWLRRSCVPDHRSVVPAGRRSVYGTYSADVRPEQLGRFRPVETGRGLVLIRLAMSSRSRRENRPRSAPGRSSRQRVAPAPASGVGGLRQRFVGLGLAPGSKRRALDLVLSNQPQDQERAGEAEQRGQGQHG